MNSNQNNPAKNTPSYVRRHSAVPWRVEEDGQTHINIHPSGKTELGVLLSHFKRSPFKHPFFGHFACMEGFWYYMRAAEKTDELRYLSGYAAKKLGRSLTANWSEHFREDILAANYQKIIQNPSLMQMFIESELPFSHYYVDTGPGQLLINSREAEWLVAGFEKLRREMKEHPEDPPTVWVNASMRYVSEMTDRRAPG